MLANINKPFPLECWPFPWWQAILHQHQQPCHPGWRSNLYVFEYDSMNRPCCWLSHLPLWKMMDLKSVGMMKFPTEWKKIIVMFQSPPTRDLFTGKLGHEKHVQPTTVFTVQPVLLLIYPIFHSPMFVGWNRLFAAETHCGKSHSEASWYSRRWKPRGSYKMDVFPWQTPI